MRQFVKLDSGDKLEMQHYGIGVEPLCGQVRDVIALYILGISSFDAEKIFNDGTSFIIEKMYDESDGPKAGKVEEITNYIDFIVAGPVIDPHDGTVIVKMGKITQNDDQSLRSKDTGMRINALNRKIDEMNRTLAEVIDQKNRLEEENIRIKKEFEAMQEVLNAMKNAQAEAATKPAPVIETVNPVMVVENPVIETKQVLETQTIETTVEEPEPIPDPVEEKIPAPKKRGRKPADAVEEPKVEKPAKPKPEKKVIIPPTQKAAAPATEKKPTRTRKKKAF